MFHHTKRYNSWSEFINHDYAFGCNCITPTLFYWFVDQHEEYEDKEDSNEEDNNEENDKEKEDKQEGNDFDANGGRAASESFELVLVYPEWERSVGSIWITVAKEDEPLARAFIHKAQQETKVEVEVKE